MDTVAIKMFNPEIPVDLDCISNPLKFGGSITLPCWPCALSLRDRKYPKVCSVRPFLKLTHYLQLCSTGLFAGNDGHFRHHSKIDR